MSNQLWNIAGVAGELGVTPQAASAWHRGPENTPAPSFRVVNTGLELWTVEDIEAWHAWVEARETAAREAKAAKRTKASEPDAEDSVVAEDAEADKVSA